MQEEAENNKKRKKNDPPIDRNNFIVRLPDDIIYKLFKRYIKENIYRNRGYILDGYPRTYEDAKGIWFDLDENKPEDALDRLVLNKEILPNNVIKISELSDEFLKNRIKNMPDSNIGNSYSHNNEEGLSRRLLAYKNNNESVKGDPSVTEFFIEKKIDLLSIDGKLNENNILEKIKIFLERNGTINNFQKHFEEDEKKSKSIFEQKLDLDISKNSKETNEYINFFI
jgi:adenylate kinase